jgi:F0F1-type ATP synthase assembly protein I
MASIFDQQDEPEREEEPIIAAPFEPESMPETARRSGLAYSAGIVFFGSVAFMLFLGWGADLLLGTSPWGLVAGVVLGSVIGFTQFFRITSRIFAKSSADGPAVRPLMSREETHDDTSRL